MPPASRRWPRTSPYSPCENGAAAPLAGAGSPNASAWTMGSRTSISGPIAADSACARCSPPAAARYSMPPPAFPPPLADRDGADDAAVATSKRPCPSAYPTAVELGSGPAGVASASSGRVVTYMDGPRPPPWLSLRAPSASAALRSAQFPGASASRAPGASTAARARNGPDDRSAACRLLKSHAARPAARESAADASATSRPTGRNAPALPFTAAPPARGPPAAAGSGSAALLPARSVMDEPPAATGPAGARPSAAALSPGRTVYPKSSDAVPFPDEYGAVPFPGPQNSSDASGARPPPPDIPSARVGGPAGAPPSAAEAAPAAAAGRGAVLTTTGSVNVTLAVTAAYGPSVRAPPAHAMPNDATAGASESSAASARTEPPAAGPASRTVPPCAAAPRPAGAP